MEEFADDPRSTPDLFAAALRSDDDVAWAAIPVLQRRGSREVLDRAIGLTRSDDAFMRMRGADILGQLGIPVRTFPEECFQSIVPLLADGDLGVLDSAITALGHLDRDRAADFIAPFQSYEDGDIRLAVAMALSGAEAPMALEALMRLMTDPDNRVRDWATFGMGGLSTTNTPEIRNALAAQLDDPDDMVRYEATCGLGLRRDGLAVAPLIAMLEDVPDGFFLREAAGVMLGEPDGHEVSTPDLIDRLRRIP